MAQEINYRKASSMERLLKKQKQLESLLHRKDIISEIIENFKGSPREKKRISDVLEDINGKIERIVSKINRLSADVSEQAEEKEDAVQQQVSPAKINNQSFDDSNAITPKSRVALMRQNSAPQLDRLNILASPSMPIQTPPNIRPPLRRPESTSSPKLVRAASLGHISPEELRKKEPGKKGRSGATKHKESYSSALSLQSILDDDPSIFQMPQEELNFFAAHKKSLISIAKDNIIEHAARRVDLFFYILVAYYFTDIFPEQEAKNELQHGSGRNAGGKKTTQAAHSCFFPGLMDKSMKQSTKEFRRKRTDVNRKGILTGTHFADSMNSTVELPKFVNDLDSILEGVILTPSELRKGSMKIIHKAVKGEITPMEGLTEFLKLMKISCNYSPQSQQSSCAKHMFG